MVCPATAPLPELEVMHQGLELFLPTWPDILWSAVVLLIIAAAFYRFIMPNFMAVLDKRSAMISGGLEQAEQVKEAAEQTLAQRQQMLQEARSEASAIREQAHQDRTKYVARAKKEAEQECARIEEDSARRVAAQRTEAEAALRAEVGTLATQLAGKIIGASLATQAAKSDAIDRFLDELENDQQLVGTGARARAASPSSSSKIASGTTTTDTAPVAQTVIKEHRLHLPHLKHK